MLPIPSLGARLKTMAELPSLLVLALARRGFWTTFPWDALQIQGSAGQLTLGIVTKLYFPLGDRGLTVASMVNETAGQR